jgi:hypothetical protein
MRLRDVLLRGTRAAQPAPGDVAVGTLYCVTDEANILERSAGTAWEEYSPTPTSPAAHATTHASGGSDPLKLDDLAAPDDNTDLNASTTKHGLLRKLSNVGTEFLDGTGAWSTPAGGGGGAPAAHASTHQDGGSDEIVVTGLTGLLATAQTPAAHASTHNAGGSDALAIDAAAGTGSLRTLGTAATSAAAGNDARLSDARTPTAHAASHNAGGSDALAIDAAAGTGSLRTLGTSATSAAAGNDARLSDARTPTAHASTHQTGGSDAIKLDDLAAPDDNTDLNASTSAHGLLRKLSNTATEFLNGQGAWATPAGGSSGALRQVFRGLHLRTHVDADKAAAQIMLVHADEIVLSDGSRITPSDGLVANIATSGIGGLRASQSEAASTWYKVLIGSGGSGIGLWLEQAKDSFLDEDTLGGGADDSTAEVRAATGTIAAVGQGFQTDVSGPLAFVDAKILRTGTVTGRLWCEVRSDSSGVPSATVLATSDKLDASVVSTTASYARFVFRAPYSVTAGTQYHLVVTGDWTQSDGNYIGLRRDISSPAYTRGAMSTYNGTTWTTAAWDAALRLYVTRNDNAPAPPTGYDTGYAHLGWAYNNSSSNFTPFVALDRIVSQIGIAPASSFATAISTLLDVSASLPPVPTLALCAAYSNVADDTARVIGVPGGYGDVTNDAFAIILCRPVDTEAPTVEVPTTYQALYANRSGTGTVNVRVKGYTW